MNEKRWFKQILLAMLIVVLSISSPLSFLSSKKANAAEDGNVHVTPANFLDYFTLNGATTYDSSTGIATLTPNEKNSNGNFALNNKIDVTQNFKLVGKINLGDKSNIQNGADGIGFAFHSGDPSDIGAYGGGLGIGGLEGGFGWKADSHYNGDSSNQYYYTADPSRFATPIPPDTSTPSFGAFVSNDSNKIANTYDGNDAPAQVIDQPTNNQFKDIEIDYNGATKTMSITYDGKKWSKNISAWNTSNSLAFIVSASTGNKYNLQQFQLTSFDYVTTGSVELTKVDAKDTTKHLAGAEFSVKNSDGTTIETNLVTDADGHISLDGLPFGDYQFIETKAPTGYELNAKPIPFTITSENETTPVQVTATNTEQLGSVLLTKVDKDDSDKVLSGAEFKLTDADGKILQENLTTNANGELKVNDLLLGSYSLVETKAPTGYILDDSPVKFTITADNYDTTIDLNKENTEMKGSVQLTKVDSQDSDKTLQGAEFKLTDA
ncbi:lectin-like domain-containing protein, partial [Listeria grayi]|uniref:lectin-like domain-containing protein n=1 Tax=Listeria grayi TaxID=1641 RepID=UPI0017A954F9